MALLAYATSWFWPSNSPSAGQNLASAEHSGEILTVGERRNAILETLTIRFKTRNPDKQLFLVEGRQLAPLKFINNELRKSGASWRVDIENGHLDFDEVASSGRHRSRNTATAIEMRLV